MLSDSAPIGGVRYDGFPLDRPVGQNNYGMVSLADCQFLCNITDQCLFFNFNRTEGTCWLKYGMGERFEDDNFTFGFKERAGLNILTVPHLQLDSKSFYLKIYFFLTYLSKLYSLKSYLPLI